MRKMLLALVLTAALAAPAAAFAGGSPGPSPRMTCGTTCTGGGSGWTGCTNQTASHSASVWGVASITHFLVVSYCKVNGTITSISIVAHGCDTSGLVACSPGPAWLTGGGVGYGWASFEAHATWHVTPLSIYNGTDVLTLNVPTG